jgi:hypothetical protein
MNTRRPTKLLHEGDHAAEVEVDLIDAEEGWAPYLSLADALKLDAVRQALQAEDREKAQFLGRIFRLVSDL